ncbi:MAG: cytidylate kinase family protein [candidate division NC10 bacterium]|nr:cytidylate kinase family protein [candidate division NC10 bacterium]
MAIITISRGTFTGGEALAAAVADRLGYRCLSRESILEAARDYGVPIDKLRAAMETTPTLWERLVGQRTAYLVYIRAALSRQALTDNLVYHGYVAHLLLPAIPHVLSVRVIADSEFRLQAVMKQQRCEQAEARAYIEKVDRERRRWVQFIFGVDWEDPHLYDMVVNLSRMTMETACDTVIRLTERPEFRSTDSSRQALQNLALANHVTALLAQDPRTNQTTLDVVADGGILTITGTTRSQAVLDAVPEVARKADGVKDVHAKIALAPIYSGFEMF